MIIRKTKFKRTPKSYYLQRPVLFFFLVLFFFFYLIYLFLHDFFFKFTYSGTSDDGSVNAGSPPSQRYTVTNLVPDTFYKLYFDVMGFLLADEAYHK